MPKQLHSPVASSCVPQASGFGTPFMHGAWQSGGSFAVAEQFGPLEHGSVAPGFSRASWSTQPSWPSGSPFLTLSCAVSQKSIEEHILHEGKAVAVEQP